MLENGLLPIQHFKESDVFVCGYPKSGNTWFQSLLSGIVFGVDPEFACDSLTQDLVPDVHYRKYYRRYGNTAYFKSHDLPQKKYRRVVYLLRDGRDVMVSYYHHLRALHSKIDFLKLVRGDGHPVGFWHHHVESWIANPFQAEMIVIKYENLKAQPLSELIRFCDFLGIHRDPSEISRVINKASIENARKKEKQMGLDNPAWPREHAFFRRGIVGSYQDEMPPEVLSAFLKVAEPTLLRQGYLPTPNLQNDGHDSRKERLTGVVNGLIQEDPSPTLISTAFPPTLIAKIERAAEEAAVFLNEKRNEEALASFERLTVLNPGLPGPQFGKAVALARLGKREEAKITLTNLLLHTPSFGRAKELLTALEEKPVLELFQKAQAAFAGGMDLEAHRLLIKAKAFRQPEQGLDELRARVFIALRQPESALEAIKEELRYFPNNKTAQALLSNLIAKHPHLTTGEISDQEFKEIYAVVRPYTMLSEKRLYSLFTLAKQICAENLPGNFVECGVAAGGSSALLAHVIKKYSRTPRTLFSFDSFEGMPEPKQEDRHAGTDAQATGWGAGTCAAPEKSLREICNKVGAGEKVVPVKGYFENTLSQWQNRIGMIALLHMDGDWYSSTKSILDNLYARLQPNGALQIDDYGHWEGCRKAVNEFESTHQIKLNPQTIDATGVWCRKPNGFPINQALEESTLKEFNRVSAEVQSIESQMSINERFQLFYTVRNALKPNAAFKFIEIGSWAGASLKTIHTTAKLVTDKVLGFSVEPNGRPQFYEVLKELDKEAVHLKMFSGPAADILTTVCAKTNTLADFIFVDGDHTYEGVKKDIEKYYPLLIPGGMMVFHDFLPTLNEKNREAILSHHGGAEPGIRRACEELMERTYRSETIDIPLLYPDDPSQTQAHLPIISGVYSTLRAYRKPLEPK